MTTHTLLPVPRSGQSPDVNWNLLLQPLTTHLRDLEAHLLHGQPLQDPLSSSAYTSLHHHHTLFLSGHSLLLGVTLLVQHDTDPETLSLVQDLACTVARLFPSEVSFAHVFEHLADDLQHDRTHGVPLHLHEIHQVATLLLQRFTLLGQPYPPFFQSSALFPQLHQPTLSLDHPLTPPLTALYPDPTLAPERQAREAALYALLQSATLSEEQYAALLLLHLNARDRYTNHPINVFLNMAGACLLIARDRHTEARTSAVHTQALRTHLLAMHQELGRVRVPALRPGSLIKRTDRPRIVHRALNLLRQTHYHQLADASPVEAAQQHLLWRALDRLEDHWRKDLSPIQQEQLHVRLMLRCCCTLTDMHRAPGMGLPPLVEVAAQLSGLDPLWGWKELQPDAQTPHHEHVGQALRQVLTLLDLADAFQVDELGERLRNAAGHLLACCRHAGLRLPQQAAFERMMGGEQHPLRASCFSPREFAAFRIRVASMLEQVDADLLLTAAAEAREALPEGVPQVLDAETLEPIRAAPDFTMTAPLAIAIDPPHLQDARAILQGRRLVLIGGVPDAAHHRAIMTSLGLADLDWIAADEYAHGTHAHARLTDQTALVVIAIRWMGHAHSTLREVARAKGIPYVMHPGGLNPNSLAWQILQQTSRQLGTLAS